MFQGKEVSKHRRLLCLPVILYFLIQALEEVGDYSHAVMASPLLID